MSTFLFINISLCSLTSILIVLSVLCMGLGLVGWLVGCLFCRGRFETEFLYIEQGVLKLALQTGVTLNSEIHLSLPPKCCN